MYQYFYAVWCLMFLAVWLAVFLARTDVRKEMFSMSFLFGVGGLASQKVYIVDWWRPLTVTHTKIGFEDFVIGFCIGGIAAVIYEEIYHKHLAKKPLSSLPPKDPLAYLLAFPLVFLTLFYIMDVNSFYATAISYIVFIAYMLIVRADLAKDSFYSGFWVLIIGMWIYYLLFLIYPNYIKQFWLLPDRWYSTLVLGVPISEYIFFFLTGMYIGPLYEFIKKSRLVKSA